MPAISDHLGIGVAGYVFVDASIPEESTLPAIPEGVRDLAREGVAPPWTDWWPAGVLETLLPEPSVRERFRKEAPSIPVALLEEAWPVPPRWPDASCAYIKLSAAYDGEAERARNLGWRVSEIEEGHLHMLVDPARVADEIRRMTRAQLRNPLA